MTRIGPAHLLPRIHPNSLLPRHLAHRGYRPENLRTCPPAHAILLATNRLLFSSTKNQVPLLLYSGSGARSGPENGASPRSRRAMSARSRGSSQASS